MNVQITVTNQDDASFVYNRTIENFAELDGFVEELHTEQEVNNQAHLEAGNDYLVTNNVFTILNVRVL